VKPWISLTLEILDKLIALDKLNKQKVKMLDGKKQDEQKVLLRSEECRDDKFNKSVLRCTSYHKYIIVDA